MYLFCLIIHIICRNRTTFWKLINVPVIISAWFINIYNWYNFVVTSCYIIWLTLPMLASTASIVLSKLSSCCWSSCCWYDTKFIYDYCHFYKGLSLKLIWLWMWSILNSYLCIKELSNIHENWWVWIGTHNKSAFYITLK